MRLHTQENIVRTCVVYCAFEFREWRGLFLRCAGNEYGRVTELLN